MFTGRYLTFSTQSPRVFFPLVRAAPQLNNLNAWNRLRIATRATPRRSMNREPKRQSITRSDDWNKWKDGSPNFQGASFFILDLGVFPIPRPSMFPSLSVPLRQTVPPGSPRIVAIRRLLCGNHYRPNISWLVYMKYLLAKTSADYSSVAGALNPNPTWRPEFGLVLARASEFVCLHTAIQELDD